MRERRCNPAKREEFERLRLNLLARLSIPCAHMSNVQLDDLTRTMTRLRRKFETKTGLPSITDH